MAKKMYYTEQEAGERLKVTPEELAKHVRDAKLRIFQDGPRKMFRVEEVDKLAADSGQGDQVALGDAISLTEAAEPGPPGKEDTVITAEGISIFDDEDLEIETADPMAKTQIAASIEDQVALEGGGSGSGLLDLTRESDDTSLWADVLDHIDVEGEAGAAAVAEAEPGLPAIVAAEAAAAAHEQVIVPTYVEVTDAADGLFGGIVVACAAVSALIAVVAIGGTSALPLGYLESLRGNVAIVLVISIVVIAVGAVLGWLTGRAAVARQTAFRQMGA